MVGQLKPDSDICARLKMVDPVYEEIYKGGVEAISYRFSATLNSEAIVQSAHSFRMLLEKMSRDIWKRSGKGSSAADIGGKFRSFIENVQTLEKREKDCLERDDHEGAEKVKKDRDRELKELIDWKVDNRPVNAEYHYNMVKYFDVTQEEIPKNDEVLKSLARKSKRMQDEFNSIAKRANDLPPVDEYLKKISDLEIALTNILIKPQPVKSTETILQVIREGETTE